MLGNTDDCWYMSSDTKHPTMFRIKSCGNGYRANNLSSSMGYLCDLLDDEKLADVSVSGGDMPVDLHSLQMTSMRDISPSRPNSRK